VAAGWEDRGTAPAVQARDLDWEAVEVRVAREPAVEAGPGVVVAALAREEAAGVAAVRVCGNRAAGQGRVALGERALVAGQVRVG
jgi:hypothetical protein